MFGMCSINLNVNLTKSMPSAIEIEHKIDIRTLNESLPIALDFSSPF